jgi:hypothetical protein
VLPTLGTETCEGKPVGGMVNVSLLGGNQRCASEFGLDVQFGPDTRDGTNRQADRFTTVAQRDREQPFMPTRLLDMRRLMNVNEYDQFLLKVCRQGTLG